MRVGLFVDTVSLYYPVKQRYAGKLDYKKLRLRATSYGELVKCVAYGSDIRGSGENFARRLQEFGYETKFREPVALGGGGYAPVVWDFDIAMDAIAAAGELSTLVLATSSAAMSRLARSLRAGDVTVIVVGCGLPAELAEAADMALEVNRGDLER